MRCLELFAGAGGAALGLERAGLEHAALCEWDAHACATLRAAGLGPVVEGDVRDLEAIGAVVGPEPVDVLWSSFPCQAFSSAGKRHGARDERNGWPWTVAALDRFCPRWFLGENVRGLISHKGTCSREGDPLDCSGCYFEQVILPDLRRRFACVGWWLLDAADYGVPQHRRRVILWAGPVALEAPRPTHGPRSGRGWVTSGQALGGRVYCFATHPEGASAVANRRVRELTHQPCPTIGAEYTGRLGGQPWVTVREALGLDGTLQSGVGHRACATRGAPRASTSPAPTVPAGTRLYYGAARYAPRRSLTVSECAVLQDFPAGHPWQGPVIAQYRQVGNAVPPRLAEAVARTVVAAAR
jgi:DNA (cytosine-5)-methyltransferase 1